MTSVLSKLALDVIHSNYVETADNNLKRYIIDVTPILEAFKLSLASSGYDSIFITTYFKLFTENVIIQRADDPNSIYEIENIAYVTTMDIDSFENIDTDNARDITTKYMELLNDTTILIYHFISTTCGESNNIIPLLWEERNTRLIIVLLENDNLDLDVIYT